MEPGSSGLPEPDAQDDFLHGCQFARSSAGSGDWSAYLHRASCGLGFSSMTVAFWEGASLGEYSKRPRLPRTSPWPLQNVISTLLCWPKHVTKISPDSRSGKLESASWCEEQHTWTRPVELFGTVFGDQLLQILFPFYSPVKLQFSQSPGSVQTHARGLTADDSVNVPSWLSVGMD